MGLVYDYGLSAASGGELYFEEWADHCCAKVEDVCWQWVRLFDVDGVMVGRRSGRKVLAVVRHQGLEEEHFALVRAPAAGDGSSEESGESEEEETAGDGSREESGESEEEELRSSSSDGL